MRRFAFLTVAPVACALALCAGPVLADGELDSSFGTLGTQTTDFGGGNDSANALAIQSDGKIVVVGASVGSISSDFAVARYLPDGQLDAVFGDHGKVVTDFGGDEVANAVAIQADGKIVVAGTRTRLGGSDFVLARYGTDGTLDPSFDGDGKRVSDIDGDDFAQALAIQADGKIVVGGTRTNSNGSAFSLVRYNPDGSFDTTFNGNGKRLTRFGGDDLGQGVAIQADGKIVLAGTRTNSTGSSFALARFNPDGSFDTGFNGNGKRITDFGADAFARSIALRADGKIVVAGWRARPGGADFAVAMYNPDGTPDSWFDHDGRTLADLGGEDRGQAVAIQADGKIVAAGTVLNGTASRLGFARFRPDGDPDTTLQGTGTVTTSLGSGNGSVQGVAIQSDGKIVVAGTVNSAGGSDFVLARYASSIVQPIGTLEVPQAGSAQSGVGLVSGWVCRATEVGVMLDGTIPLGTAYGTARGDTLTACGDTNNGFGALLNWNLLGDGPHSIRAFADGAEFGSAEFTVTTLGTRFLRGASGTFPLAGFPRQGIAVSLTWDQSQQNFVVFRRQRPAAAGVGTPGPIPGILEIPQPSSFQSGIGLISGWACNVSGVTVELDGRQTLATAYGTARQDTAAQCGTTNNGFGLLFNWNLLGDGVHRIRALADGVEIARANFTVTTLGTRFLRGASASFTLPGFPASGSSVMVQWDESRQNFSIVGKE